MHKKNRNYSLDMARCLAIVLVFGIHAFQNIFSPDIPFIWYLAYAGVELFFALSGFLIGKILLDMLISNDGKMNFIDLKNFLMRRWLRTLPLYYIILLILLALNLIQKNDTPDEWKYFFFLNNLTSSPPAFFGESWSLAIEEWFYLLFSSMLFIATSFLFRPKKTAALKATYIFLLLLITFIIVTWLIKIVSFNAHFYNEAFTIVIFRLDAIAYGMLAYWLYHTVSFKKPHTLLIMMLSTILIVIAILIRFTYPDNGWKAMGYYLLAGAGYAGFVLALNMYSFKKQYWLVSHLSKISYSIYITHLSLILIPLLRFFQPATISRQMVFLITYILITYTVSTLTYQIIEKPFNKIRDRFFTTNKIRG